MGSPSSADPTRSTFVVDRAESALLVEARSTVGPIELGTTEIVGSAELSLTPAGVDLGASPVASLQLPVESLSSGNALYDAEVHRRLDARRFPTIRAELRSAQSLDATRWALAGELTIHGTTRSLSGSADVQVVDGSRMRIYGEQVIDIRDFAISLPTTLMLRIYPDVRIRFRLDVVRGS